MNTHIEFVAKDNLWWRVVRVVMSLVVLVPLKPCDNTIEVAGFSGTVLVLPKIDLFPAKRRRKKEERDWEE